MSEELIFLEESNQNLQIKQRVATRRTSESIPDPFFLKRGGANSLFLNPQLSPWKQNPAEGFFDHMGKGYEDAYSSDPPLN